LSERLSLKGRREMKGSTILKAIENGILRWKQLADYTIGEDGDSLWLKTKDGSEFVISVKTINEE
jgi:hypothetical protein